jgi:hypothetical protein
VISHDVACESEISNFADAFVVDEYIAGRQVTMNNLMKSTVIVNSYCSTWLIYFHAQLSSSRREKQRTPLLAKNSMALET